MIAYKDAIRHHVCIGDKVLAPWQDDGRYGPGTVLDGVDRRDVQPQGMHSVQCSILQSCYLGLFVTLLDKTQSLHQRTTNSDPPGKCDN